MRIKMSQEIRVHQYSGKEKGIMVIGTASALNELGHELVTRTEKHPELVEEEWPKLVASRELGTAPDYAISFHIETTRGNTPSTKKESEILRTVFFVFAIIGVVATVKWIVSLLQ
jgi:hypothetical protein